MDNFTFDMVTLYINTLIKLKSPISENNVYILADLQNIVDLLDIDTMNKVIRQYLLEENKYAG